MDQPTPRLRLLHELLTHENEPCPNCKYNLRGLTGDRCPECNQQLVLRVGLREPMLGLFITGLVGICMGLGFSALLVAYALMRVLDRRGGVPHNYWHPTLIGTAVGIFLLIIWIRVRPRMNQRGAVTYWCAAIVVTAASLACPIWFFYLMR